MSGNEALTIVLSNLFGFIAGYICCAVNRKGDAR